jgi:hypothetical protein
MSWELIVNEKYNQDFRGHAERCTYTFSLTPEQVPGTHWSAMQVVAAHNEELASQGSDLLELKMWEDTSPTWTTDYLVEVVATASPLWWNLIIIGVLAILVVIAIYFVIQKVDDIAHYLGATAPITLPLLALGGVALATAALVYVVRRGKNGET